MGKPPATVMIAQIIQETAIARMILERMARIIRNESLARSDIKVIVEENFLIDSVPALLYCREVRQQKNMTRSRVFGRARDVITSNLQ